MLRISAVLAATAFFAMPALAATSFSATLETPVTEKARLTAYDAVWICEADTCQAELKRKSATVRVCKKVVSEIGPVKTFGTSEDLLSEEEIAQCNASLN